jgi:serine/threonine-protein kinase
MASVSCPSADRLQQLLTEESPAAGQAALIAHLDRCTDCQRTLETLAGANPALLRAASALERTTYVAEAPLRRVLDDLERDANLTIQSRPYHRTAWVRSLLRPGESHECLGRLDHYEVTELLGQGGTGLVLKALDPALKRWVAIKVLAPDLASDPVARQRFAREAQAAAAVRHENVILIHAVSESNGLPFFVMEFVAGGSLQDYLDRGESSDWRTAARLGAEIATGLAAAHARGLIHRDIKPSNILLQAEGTPTDPGIAKISDFGLVRITDESRLTQTGIVAGTPMYMAPEQALCEPLDARADLFSLGSVLYALCTGREPFPADSPMAVLRKVCETLPRPVQSA